MPVTVRRGKGKRPWKIVEKSTGKIKGSSVNKADAESSARAINASLHGWKPKGKRRIKR